MAKTDADDAKKKQKKKAGAVRVEVKVKKAKKAKPAKPAKAAKPARKAPKPGKSEHKAAETLAKLAEHPLVADLIAVGATAAVAALAARSSSEKQDGNAVKLAGKAAASAIGKKLMDELRTVKDAATAAAKKA